MTTDLWHFTSEEHRKYSMLRGDINVDYLIIGGGFTGCSAALKLAQSGARVALLEAHQIGYGGSGRNVGLVNAGLWLSPDAVEMTMGREAGKRLNQALAEAPKEVFELIKRHDIQCEAVQNGTLHLAHSPKGLKDLEIRLGQQLARNAPVRLLDAAETARRTGTEAYHGALHDQRAGTVHPLAYVQGLARAAREAGAEISEMSPVTALRYRSGQWQAKTAQATVKAAKILIATNAYHLGLKGFNAPKSAKVSFFQLATRPVTGALSDTILPGREGCWDTGLIMSSLRRDLSGRVIFGAMGRPEGLGGGIHKHWARNALARLYPQLADQEFSQFWSGEIAMTSDHIPKAIRFGPNALCLMGYSGRGIAPGTRLGRLAAECLMTGDETRLPLPVLAQYNEGLKGLRTGFYEFGARLIHLGQRIFPKS